MSAVLGSSAGVVALVSWCVGRDARIAHPRVAYGLAALMVLLMGLIAAFAS